MCLPCVSSPKFHCCKKPLLSMNQCQLWLQNWHMPSQGVGQKPEMAIRPAEATDQQTFNRRIIQKDKVQGSFEVCFKTFYFFHADALLNVHRHCAFCVASRPSKMIADASQSCTIVAKCIRKTESVDCSVGRYTAHLNLLLEGAPYQGGR